MAPSVERTIVRGDFQPTLEEALVERVLHAKARDPLAPVHIVVPSNLLRVHLRRRLGEAQAFLGVRIDSLRSIVEELAFPAVARRGLVAMPDLAGRIFAEAAIAAMPKESTFEPLRAMPGFPGRLTATIRDLRDAAITPEALASAAESRKVKDLAALYADFESRRRAAKLVDDAGLAALATAEIGNGASIGSDASLFVYGFYDFVSVQQRFVEALLARHGGAIFSPVPDGEVGAFGRPFLDRLRELGFREVTTKSRSSNSATNDLALLRARLLDRDASPESRIRGDGSVRFLAPRFRGEEPREVLRLVRELVERGVALHEIGIVYRQRGGVRLIAAEVARLARELEGASVPLFEQGGHALSETPAGRSLIRLAEALHSKFRRPEVLAFLDAAGRFPRTPAWARIARRAGITGGNGADEWLDSLARVAKSNRRGDVEDGEEGTLDVEARRARDAAELRAVVSRLRDVARSIDSAKSFAAAAAGLRAGFRTQCGDDAAMALESAFAALAEADVAEATFDSESFLELVEDAVRGASTSAGAFEKGLLAGGLLGVRGLPFRVVILPSLEEGVFPRRAAQDPLFLDDERRAISARVCDPGEPGLPRPTERAAAEERLLFHFACAAARETLVISCARFEDASEKELAPSSAWRGALEALLRAPLPKDDVRRDPVLKSLFVASSTVLDLSEWDRGAMSSATRVRDGSRARFLAELDPIAAQALRGEISRRRSRVFTEYDGIVAGEAWDARAKELLAAQLSVTRIERYAMCPFKFFAGSVLEIDPDDPRKEATIDFRAHGDVIHEAAEHFFYKLAKRDEPWPLDPSRKDALREELLEIGRAVFDEHARSTALPRVVLDAERLRVDDDLLALLAYEYDSTRPERPSHFERKFGGADGPPVELGDEHARLRFLGEIDRIDVDRARKTAIVVDYKTGKKPTQKKHDAGLDGGRALQLPVYALGAQRVLGPAYTVEKSEYFFCTRRADGVRYGPDRGGFSGEGLATLESTIAELARNLRAGHFFPDPSDDDLCTQCELRVACGKGKFLDIAYDKKSADPRVASFQALRASAGDDDEESEP